MAEISGGELLVRCLKKEGLKRIFGIPDDSYFLSMEQAKKDGIRWICPRHEAAAVHMAEGVYKTTGEVPVVMSGAGPGTANLVSGIVNAQHEGVPVIAITGQRRPQVVYPIRAGVFQGQDQLELFKPIVKWNAVVHDWNRIPEIVERGYREALAGRPGPVHIDIPDEISYEMHDEDSVRILEPNQYRGRLPEPSTRQIEEIARLIKDAKNPLVLAGQGVLNSGGTDELIALVEMLNCPVASSTAARTVIPQNHPNYLFGLMNAALLARTEADVILAIGTRIGEMDLPFSPYFGDISTQKLIQVDIDPKNLGTNWPITLGILGDAKPTLKSLVDCLGEMGVKAGDGKKLAEYKAIEDAQWSEMILAVDAYSGGKIHPAKSVMIANEVFTSEAINVGDGGNTSLFNGVFSRFTIPRTSLGLFEFGHLGVGIPYAMGAKLANPDRDVYVITGDGAAGFNFMEIETAVRENINITVIVHAEESWCMEEIGMIMAFEGDLSRIMACEQSPVRWDKVAEGMGAHGEYVEKVEELPDALRRAKESDTVTAVCVKIDKQANLIPPLADKFYEVYSGPTEE